MKYILLAFVVFLAGCSVSFQPFGGQKSTSLVDENSTPKQIVYETVKKTDWLITVSIIGIALSVYAFFAGGRNSLPAIAACGVCLTLSLTVKAFGWYLAIVGLVMAGLTAIYYIFIKTKALKEIVKNIQQYKDDENLLIRAALADQSKTTKQIVKDIKENL